MIEKIPLIGDHFKVTCDICKSYFNFLFYDESTEKEALEKVFKSYTIFEGNKHICFECNQKAIRYFLDESKKNI